jgi:hypothetical protein
VRETENRIPSTVKRREFWTDALMAAACGAALSGIPSTLYAWAIGGDLMEPTRAAGAMLIRANASDRELFWAAALVHSVVSTFWAAVLTWVLPHKRTFIWAVVAAAGIALLDLRVIGRWFAEIHALPFWPQFADHLAWGALVGAVLSWRWRERPRIIQ